MILLWGLFMAALPGSSQAISCYKCTGFRSNNTCVDKYRQKVTSPDGQFMCRVFERNGVVVSQGVVGPQLCTNYKKLLPGTSFKLCQK